MIFPFAFSVDYLYLCTVIIKQDTRTDNNINNYFMKALRYIAVTLTALTAQTSMAQGWQIEGGLGNRENKQETYSDYYEPETQEYGDEDNFESPISIVFGYVNKTWNTDMDGTIVKENFWGDRNKRLHGFQIGFLYQPAVDLGGFKFGLSTGLSLECYISTCQRVRDTGYDRFSEFGTYIPLHGQFTIPLTPKASISFYGGLGMNLAIVGTFEEDETYYDHYYHERYTETYYDYENYGNGQNPRHLNFQTEYGASLKIHNWGINFTYSQGLTDHKLYQQEGYKTYQNKINIGLSYTF